MCGFGKNLSVTENDTQKPSNPREDLEVEVAPGATSNYGLMRVHFIDVGQADSTFIELGNGQMIDCPRALLPPNAKESSILNITVDEVATNDKLQTVTKRMNRLFND